MIVISIIGLMMIGLIVYQFMQLVLKGKAIKNSLILNSGILFLGSFAFLFGIFYQLLGMYQAYHAILEAGDISGVLILEGFLISCFAPGYGLAFLLVGLICWFLFKIKLHKLGVLGQN